MIGEGKILFRIQHFQQGRGGITAKITSDFVNFIQHKNRTHGTDIAHRLHDATWHGANIRAPMPTNLRFISHAT